MKTINPYHNDMNLAACSWAELCHYQDAFRSAIELSKTHDMPYDAFTVELEKVSDAMDNLQDEYADSDHNDYMMDQDVSAVQLAGEQFEDRLAMYRREY